MERPKDICIKIGSYEELGADAHFVRNQVFCVEQRISEDIEWDACDDAATHVVLYKNNKAVSTGRMIRKENAYYIGRVATLKEYRGNGYGSSVTQSLVDWAAEHNIGEVHLHAQKYVEAFYKKLGFESYGDVFQETGIEHISMVIRI